MAVIHIHRSLVAGAWPWRAWPWTPHLCQRLVVRLIQIRWVLRGDGKENRALTRQFSKYWRIRRICFFHWASKSSALTMCVDPIFFDLSPLSGDGHITVVNDDSLPELLCIFKKNHSRFTTCIVIDVVFFAMGFFLLLCELISAWHSQNSTWLVTTRHVRRVEPMHFGCVELVEQHGLTRSSRRARHFERVVSFRDVAWLAKWNLDLCRTKQALLFISAHIVVLSRIFGIVRLWTYWRPPLVSGRHLVARDTQQLLHNMLVWFYRVESNKLTKWLNGMWDLCWSLAQYVYTVAWSRIDGRQLPSHVVDDGQGSLQFHDVRLSDEATYICTGSNYYSVATDEAVLTIGCKFNCHCLRAELYYLHRLFVLLNECHGARLPPVHFKSKWLSFLSLPTISVSFSLFFQTFPVLFFHLPSLFPSLSKAWKCGSYCQSLEWTPRINWLQYFKKI